MKLGRKNEAIMNDLACLFEEFELDPKMNVGSLKGMNSRNTILR